MILCSFASQSVAEDRVKPSQFDMNHIGVSGVSDFTPHGTQSPLTFRLSGVSECGDCHGSGGFGQEPDDIEFMPVTSWAGSMMANAARDPLFWAAVDIANQDIPGVGDFCIRCHSPIGFYAGNTKDGTGDLSYANGCQLDGDQESPESKLNDYQGVNCHFCHRQEPLDPMTKLHNSNIVIDDQNCENPNSDNNFGPCRKGPYNDYNTNPDLSQPPHSWEYSPFIKQGEFCGSCHNVSSPEVVTNGVANIAKTLIDSSTGIDLGVAMPIERTFDEWKNSLFSDLLFKNNLEMEYITNERPVLVKGETCQDCHMPQADNINARACVFTTPGSRFGNLKTHEFAGGNSWMPAVIKNTYGAGMDSDNLDRSAAFDRTILSALDMLQNKSALIETSLVSASSVNAEVNVKVTNLTGHKLPSGYLEGRRIWINLEVKDNNDTLIFESGAYNEATAELDETGAKIYESHQGIWDSQTNECVFEENGIKSFHFVLNNCIVKDNRIPPLGFMGGDNIELRPVGYSYPARPGYPNQLVNYDETTYNFAIPNGAVFPLSVTATLKFQTASKEYIDFLQTESSMPSENDLCNFMPPKTIGPANQSRGDFMKQLWDNNGKSAPVDMAFSTIEVTN